jgi:FkbM family methyltransferase
MKIKCRSFFTPVYFSLTQDELKGYYSQLGQDLLIEKFYLDSSYKNKYFVDVGAHDGITYSNTYLFEKKYNWKGLCIEPNPNIFIKLKQNRNCIVENLAVSSELGSQNFIAIEGHSNMLSGIESNYSKKHLKRIKNEVKIYNQKVMNLNIKTNTLKILFDEYEIEKVSFISIDTEGSELEVLKSIDFKDIEIDFIVIENNEQRRNIKKYLRKFEYHCALKIESEEISSHQDNILQLRSVANQYFQRKSFIRVFFGKFFRYVMDYYD